MSSIYSNGENTHFTTCQIAIFIHAYIFLQNNNNKKFNIK